ncbi:MAG: DUF1194 domain-containing protein [Alphaproteobacteria bacterium]|nr:MAG: DUF1194 domain-containing protein [Alphaproteobacteria bacterium]
MRGMAILAALILALGGPRAAADVEVDVELVLAVDVSRSMTMNEREIQRRGYAEALVSAPVLQAIRSGMLGRVAIAYVEWAGADSQRVVVDWTLIRDAADAAAFARRLSADPGMAMRRTSISGAIDFAARMFDGNGFSGLRRVIDISGDGPNNQGRPVTGARDDAVAAGLVINGLPLMTREGAGLQWQLDDLDGYYRDCVIGGPGAFVIPVRDWGEFAAAVRRKLVLEIAGIAPPAPARLVPAADAPRDCLVGERIWERMRREWMQP